MARKNSKTPSEGRSSNEGRDEAHHAPRVGRLPYSGLGNDAVSRLEEANGKLGGKVFDFHLHKLRTKNFVGVVAAGGTTVEILPKIHEGNAANLGYLLALLRYTGTLTTKRGEVADLGEHGGSFLEAWIHHFAAELNRLLRANYKQKYVEVEERSSFVRGKLLTERDLGGSSKIHARYPCRYEIFTPDHLLNRTLKFCNSLLMKQTRSPANRTLLRQNDALLADVEDAPVFARDLDRIHLDRLNREYEPILELCRLLLENSSLDLRAGRITQLALVFDMNTLFEKFVAEFLRRNKESIFIGGARVEKVETKRDLGRLFGEFKMEVDVALHTPGGTYLLDTKYKVLEDEKDHAGLSQPDFYQMHAYATAGEWKYGGVILLYPKTAASPPEKDFVNGRDGVRLFVRLIDPAAIHAGGGRVSEGIVVREMNAAFSGVEAVENREGAA
ncbi:MAG: McrC family protein [Rubrobacteraceae bacterium]